MFEVESVSSKFRFNRMFKNYKLNIHSFFSDDNSVYLRNIPCSLVLNSDKESLNGGTLYAISGTLLQNSSNIKLQSNFNKVEEKVRKFSLVNIRSYFQKIFKRFIWFKIPRSEARAFLEGIFSGDFQADKVMGYTRHTFSGHNLLPPPADHERHKGSPDAHRARRSAFCFAVVRVSGAIYCELDNTEFLGADRDRPDRAFPA